MRKLLALAVVATALLSLAGSGCRRSARSHTLRVIWSTDILTLDPNEKFETTTDTYAMNVFEPLLRFDKGMSYRGVLATRWAITDERTWRFFLRPGVTFHDGSPLTADDVVFTLDRIRAQKSSEIAPYLAGLSSVKAVDPLTVELVSERPAGLLAVLSFVYVLPRAALTRSGDEAFFASPIGSGPYTFVSRAPGQSLTLRANPSYRTGAPQVSEVTFLRVANGEEAYQTARKSTPSILLGVPFETFEKHKKEPGFRFLTRPGLTVNYLITNMTKQRPDNPLLVLGVRKALRAAFDYRTLATRVMAGEVFPAAQLVTPGIFGFDPGLTVPEFVPGEARRLLTEAGYQGGLDLTMNVSDAVMPFVTEIVRQLGEAGFRVKPVAASDLVQHERISRCEGDLHLSGWVCTTGDAAELFEGNFYGPSGSLANGCGYQRPELDSIIERSAKTLDPTERQALLQQAMRLVIADLPWIPLVGGYDRYALSEDLVWEPRPDGEIYVADVRLP